MMRPSDPAPTPGPIGRRTWMAGGLAGLLGVARADGPGTAEDDAEPIERKLAAAGLRNVGTTRSDRFVAVGDAPEGFRRDALELTEALAKAYLRHFAERGFPAEAPARPLAIACLAGPESYRAFTREDPGTTLGGHYDLGSNLLVMFDFRPEPLAGGPQPEKVNTLVLIHEAIHLLSFNTGLLEREADVPLAVSEGVAVYGEVWRPGRRGPGLGSPNTPRMAAVALARRAGQAWIAVEDLLLDDAPFREEATRQLAYAEAGLLIQVLLSRPNYRPRLSRYLQAIRERRDDRGRREDIRDHLGDLNRLDADVRRAARWPTRP